ncbi:MAG: imidazole glycerol phosphate synthase subunit HisH [Opitutales bacterium]
MSAQNTEAADIAVIDYGMGNIRSVTNALTFVGANFRVISGPDQIGVADGLLLPGVGALRDCIKALRESGLDAAVADWIAADKPFLGVCLGMQALFEYSEEAGIEGLGIFPGNVVKFKVPEGLKVPHMGWNAVDFQKDDPVMNRGIESGKDQFYFVHSYHVETPREDIVWARADYGYSFVSAISTGRVFATQFHPEKSQSKGLQLYRNFVELSGSAVSV